MQSMSWSNTAMAPHGRVQDFNFDLETIAPFVESFANKTGIPVGGICQDVSCGCQFVRYKPSRKFHRVPDALSQTAPVTAMR